MTNLFANLMVGLLVGLDALFVLLDETSQGTLLVVALVLGLAVWRRNYEREYSRSHYRIAKCVIVLYFARCVWLCGDDFEAVFDAAVRAAVAYPLVWSVAAMVVLAVGRFLDGVFYVAAQVDDAFRRVARHMARGFRRRWERWSMRRQPVLSPPSRPPPRAERMRRMAQAAQDDYQAEVTALAALPLDEDEREILILQAKQRLLQKLSELPQA